MYDFNPFYDRQISSNVVSKSLQEAIGAYIKHKEWGEDDIFAMLHENLICHKDGYVERVEIDFNADEKTMKSPFFNEASQVSNVSTV